MEDAVQNKVLESLNLIRIMGILKMSLIRMAAADPRGNIPLVAPIPPSIPPRSSYLSCIIITREIIILFI